MSTIDQHDGPRVRRVHPWNLAFGLAFLAVAGTWAALEHDVVDGREMGRLLAWGLIALGAVGIVGTLLATRRGRAAVTERSTHPEPAVDATTPSDDTATPDDAQAMHATIRRTLAEIYGQRAADGVRIQYGGSVKPDNVDELMAQPDIDGALVGGASLKAESFLRIVQFH